MIFPTDAGRPVKGREPPVEELDPTDAPDPVPLLPPGELPVLPFTAVVVEVVVADAFALAAAVVEVVEETLVDVAELVVDVVVEAGSLVEVVDDEVVVVVEAGSLVDVVVVEACSLVVVVDDDVVVVEAGSLVVVVDDDVVVVEAGSEVDVVEVDDELVVLPGGPGTADQTNPLGSEELAVKVISVFQLSVRTPAPVTQAMPASHTPLVPPVYSRSGNRPKEVTAGPNSKSFGKVVTTLLEGTRMLSTGAVV